MVVLSNFYIRLAGRSLPSNLFGEEIVQESAKGSIRDDFSSWPQLFWGVITRRTAGNNGNSS